MTGFTLEYTFPDDALLIMEPNQTVKYWAGMGPPTYEGSLEGFALLFAKRMEYMLERKIFKRRQ